MLRHLGYKASLICCAVQEGFRHGKMDEDQGSECQSHLHREEGALLGMEAVELRENLLGA